MFELSDLEKDLIDQLRDARFMIADPAPSHRALRDFLNRCAIQSKQIIVVSTFQEAMAEISNSRPNIVFADLGLSGGRGLELKKRHEDELSVQGVRLFFSMSNDDSVLLVNTVADEGVDGLLVRPLSTTGLRTSLFGVLSRRLRPSSYDLVVREGLEKKSEGDLSGAITLFERANRLDPTRALALAHEGRILLERGDLEAAEERFRRGLEAHPNHYRCLLGAFDSSIKREDYTTAYERAKRLSEHHTLPIPRLAEFIDVAIRNRKFQDVMELSRLVLSPDNAKSVDQRVISIGLVVAGLAFLRSSRNKQALTAFRRAEWLSQRDLALLKRIYCALVEHGLLKEAQTMSRDLPGEILESREVQLAEFHRIEKTGDRLRALQFGLTLVRAGARDKTLFRALIRYSVVLARRKSVIQSLVDLASKIFPESREEFEALIHKDKAG